MLITDCYEGKRVRARDTIFSSSDMYDVVAKDGMPGSIKKVDLNLELLSIEFDHGTSGKGIQPNQVEAIEPP